ncbi:hypothetical protein LINGRAHAP2_LOCUS15930 [Linum grandiflorum]
MATTSDMDDDDFKDIYKEYTGPVASTATNNKEQPKPKNQPQAGLDEEEEPPSIDPNAVPTDFTSREAKVWEAKSKATERNWKKRKEEELICKICGESGHFTQGCPSTLGTNRKLQDFMERVPAREKHIRALFTEKVMQRVERDIGCRLKMDEKFIIVSGKDRLILKKGVDAVHRVIKGDDDHKGSSTSHMSRSRSPERSPPSSRLRRSEPQRSYPSYPRDTSQYQPRFGRQDKIVEDRIREDMQKFSRGSPQGRDSIGYFYGIDKELVITYFVVEASASFQTYGKDGSRGRASHSKSPGRPLHRSSESYGSYDGHTRGRIDGWGGGRRGPEPTSQQLEYSSFPRALEELELEYKKEAMMLGRIHDKEEDEENNKHRETMGDIRDNYLKKLSALRGNHSRQFEDCFHQLEDEGQRQQKEAARHQMSVSGFGSFGNQQPYPAYDGGGSSSAQYPHLAGAMGSRPGYQESYPSRQPHNDNYGEFQHQRHADFGKSYNRY